MKLDSFDSLFLHELEDLYSAEKQLTEALPKMAAGATSEELKGAFEKHLEQTEGHIERLDKIFEHLQKSPGRHKCKAMEGLIKEGADLLKNDADAACY